MYKEAAKKSAFCVFSLEFLLITFPPVMTVMNIWEGDLGVSLTENNWHEVWTAYVFTSEALNIQTIS